MKFDVIHKDVDSVARCGVMHTDHGVIQTPVFMPVGTVGTVKGVLHRDLVEDMDATIILGNTYHLYLRPGMDVMSAAGGIHKFCAWDRPLLTDSGGFQVFSLAENRKITAEGCSFRSHIDGSKHLFTPENVVDIQRIIGADVMMALDECPPGDSDHKYAKKSLELTQQWLVRGLERYRQTQPLYGHEQAFFPIVQGCVYPDLRRAAAEYVATLECAGSAIGGLSVGEPVEQMYEMIEVVHPILPLDKPRYLMGVGTPWNLLEAISRGIDMFDCVMPTRNGRSGMLFTQNGIINIRNQKWATDFDPIDPDGSSFVDRTYSKAYLRHLFIASEMLGPQIASQHNLALYLWLMEEARRQIAAGTFASWKTKIVKQLQNRL
ncbi:MAG: tRNA guanosine(34) transglycosylase Tgt [Prevotellaceae bacterium]|nr:tRNA guanosine(34) transglycosylase Tgt [Prevotellaceae bacterium]